MPGIFVSSARRTEVETASPASQPRAQRFAPHERTHLLLARGVSPQLVEMLELAGFSSLAGMRQLGVGAVMAELAGRFGNRARGISPRALERALASFEDDRTPRLIGQARPAVTTAPARHRTLMVDIARAAGVAPSTVSRALDDSNQVSAQTKARIRDLAQASHYARNSVAQSLRTRRMRTVAVMVPESGATDRRLGDMQDLALIGSLADALHEAGFELTLSCPRADRMAQLRDTVAGGRAAGLVVLGTWPDAPADLPVVCWGSTGLAQTCPTVGVDISEGTRLATRLLLDLGARRVAFLPDRHASDLQAQHRGYLLAHDELGLEPATGLGVEWSAVTDTMARCGGRAGEPRFDAVVAASDWIALAAVEQLRGIGLRVPDDVSVVGFGDTPLAVRGGPALTTVQLPTRDAGQALVRLLLERMSGRQPDSVLLAPRLVVRASTRRH